MAKKSWTDIGAFRRALEDRLRNTADAAGIPVANLRIKFAIERLLARLFAKPDPPWVLKGGYALELRYRPAARTTRDIDLAIRGLASIDSAERLIELRDEIQAAADIDAGDFLEFRIGAPRGDLVGAPQGGSTFPVEVSLAGKVFANYHIDAGFGDTWLGPPDELKGQDFLAFAGIPPARVLAISTAQQFAEKIHAYTINWNVRANSRTKDLVDLFLLIEKGLVPDDSVRRAIHGTFDARRKHDIPADLENPPDNWKDDFAALAKEAGLSTLDVNVAFQLLREFWKLLNPGTP